MCYAYVLPQILYSGIVVRYALTGCKQIIYEPWAPRGATDGHLCELLGPDRHSTEYSHMHQTHPLTESSTDSSWTCKARVPESSFHSLVGYDIDQATSYNII